MMEEKNTIHFVWAGGNTLIPQEKLDKIKAWYLANPDFKIFLWIDKTTTPNALRRYEQERGIPEKYRFIYLKDITEEGVASPEIRYELDRLQANYQASSNLLRLSILARFGGAFFENDLTPNEPIARSVPIYDDGPYFQIGLETRATQQIGHAALYASALDPTLLHAVIHTHNNYQYPLELKWNDPYYYNQYDKRIPTLSCPKKTITECRSGPTALRTALFLSGQIQLPDKTFRDYQQRVNYLRENYQQINSYLVPDRLNKKFILPEKIYALPEKREPLWLKLPVRQCKTVREALRTVSKTILFEMKELSMIRDLGEMVFFIKRSLFQYYREQQKTHIERYFHQEVKQLPRLLPATKDVFIDNYLRALLNHFKHIRYDRDLIAQDFGWLKHSIKSEQLDHIKSEVENIFLKKFSSQMIRSQDNTLIDSHELATHLKMLIDELATIGHVLKYDSSPMSWQDLRVLIDYLDVDQNAALNDSIQQELVRMMGELTNFRCNDRHDEYLSQLMYFLSKRKYEENQAFIHDLQQVITTYRKKNNILIERTKVMLYFLDHYIDLNQQELISQGALAQLLRIYVSHLQGERYANYLRKQLSTLLDKHESKRAQLYLLHPMEPVAEKIPLLDTVEVNRNMLKQFKHVVAVKKSRLALDDSKFGTDE